MKKEKIVATVSVGLTARALEAVERAIAVRYDNQVTSQTRAHFLRLAAWESSSAVSRLGEEYNATFLACDLRRETPDETADRIGEPHQRQLDLPDNIVAFPAA